MSSTGQHPKAARRAPGLSLVVAVLALAAGGYALHLLGALVGELHQISAKLDKLSAMSGEVQQLSKRLHLLDDADKRLARMEDYMRYVPAIAQVGEAALVQSQQANQHFNLANACLVRTSQFLDAAESRIAIADNALGAVPAEIVHMRHSMDAVVAQLPALEDARRLLEQTSGDIHSTTAGISHVAGGMERFSGGLDRMESLLLGMGEHLSALPEMRSSLESTTDSLATTLAALQPLGDALPKLNSSIEEMSRTTTDMNRTTQEMSQTTLEMSRGLRRSTRQGALGVVVLTAAELLK